MSVYLLQNVSFNFLIVKFTSSFENTFYTIVSIYFFVFLIYFCSEFLAVTLINGIKFISL